MLTDEQIEILKIGDRGIVRVAHLEIDDKYVGGWCRHVIYFAKQLANALIDLKAAREALNAVE